MPASRSQCLWPASGGVRGRQTPSLASCILQAKSALELSSKPKTVCRRLVLTKISQLEGQGGLPSLVLFPPIRSLLWTPLLERPLSPLTPQTLLTVPR
jgi:hypothetical protein